MDRATRSGWRRHFSYSNVMSTLAVFLVLVGGTAVAAVRLQKNSVTSKTVKNGSLTGADVRDRSLGGADVADGSLGAADVADGSVTGADGGAGSLSGSKLGAGAIGAPALGKGAIGAANLAPDSVASANVATGSLQGSDVGTDVLTGHSIDESALGRVAEVATLGGHRASAFIGRIVQEESTVGVGVADGGAFVNTMICNNGILLEGGAANVAPTSSIVESAPDVDARTWRVKINTHGAGDPFNVVVLCGIPNPG